MQTAAYRNNEEISHFLPTVPSQSNSQLIVGPQSIINKKVQQSSKNSVIMNGLKQRKSMSQRKLGSLDRSVANMINKHNSIAQTNQRNQRFSTEEPSIQEAIAPQPNHPATLSKNMSVKSSQGLNKVMAPS